MVPIFWVTLYISHVAKVVFINAGIDFEKRFAIFAGSKKIATLSKIFNKIFNWWLIIPQWQECEK